MATTPNRSLRGAVRSPALVVAPTRVNLGSSRRIDLADFALDILDVDKMGLDNNDRAILLTIIQKFSGGPVGLDTLAAALGEDAGTLEDVYEPYLLMNGLINRTPRGRVATEHAYRHLDMEPV